MHFGQKAQGLFKVVNIRSKVSDKKAQEFRHIYIDSMSAAFIASSIVVGGTSAVFS